MDYDALLARRRARATGNGLAWAFLFYAVILWPAYLLVT